MKFFVQLSIDSAAFDEYPALEVATILRKIASRLEEEGVIPAHFRNCHDSDGNPVGTYAAKPDSYGVRE